MIKIGKLLPPQAFLEHKCIRLKCVRFYPLQLNVPILYPLKTSHFVPLTFSGWLKGDQWPRMGFINGQENLEWSATRPFWQNHFRFIRHRKHLQSSSPGPCQKTHLGFPKNLYNFQCNFVTILLGSLFKSLPPQFRFLTGPMVSLGNTKKVKLTP